MAGTGADLPGYSNEQIAGELEVAATTIKRISAICIRNSAWPIARMRYKRPAIAEDDGVRRVSLAG